MAINSTFLKRDPSSQHELEQWAENVIKAWVSKMDALGVLKDGNSGLLAKSFFYAIVWEARGADRTEYLHRIRFAFNFYGKLVDYGVGRGTDIKDRFQGGRSSATNPRKRKEWMREPWFAEMKKLRPIIMAQANQKLRIMLKAGFDTTADTHFKTKST